MTGNEQSSYLEFTVLGCGSSGGVPRIGNNWGKCDPSNARNRRLRCSLLVKRVTEGETTTVLIDTGPDLREQLVRAEISIVDAVLYTHPHADHLHGIDDLRQIAINSGKRVPVYMDEPTSKRAHTAFDYCFNSSGKFYRPILEEFEIRPGLPIKIDGAGGEIEFHPYYVNHGDINALMFKVRNVLYTPDIKEFLETSMEVIDDLDVWILDSLRRDEHPTHFNLEEAVNWAKRAGAGRTILTNMHIDLDYQTLCDELPENIEPAYDGLTFRVPLG